MHQETKQCNRNETIPIPLASCFVMNLLLTILCFRMLKTELILRTGKKIDAYLSIVNELDRYLLIDPLHGMVQQDKMNSVEYYSFNV